ncbi:unnamed protein product, partial [Prorocentrum cordatum]
MDQTEIDAFADLDDEPYVHSECMGEPSPRGPTPATGTASPQRPGRMTELRPQRRTPEERPRQRTEGKQASILFANITECGPQAAKVSAERGKRKYKTIAFVETHATAEQLMATQVALGKDGWRVAGTPATPSGKANTGTSGGEMWCLDKNLAATTYECHRRRHLLATGKEVFVGFCPVVLHLKEGNVVLVAIRNRLLAVGSYVSTLSDPWVPLADWNLEPPEWGRSEWLGKVGGAGQGRMYDYAVAKQGWHHRLRLQAIFDVPWKTHCAVEVIIEGSDRRWHHDELVVARSLPARERPPKAPDPESKTSRRKAEALQSRARALPPEFQETLLGTHEQGKDRHPEEEKPFFITEDAWSGCCPAWEEPVPRAGQMEYFINAGRPDDAQAGCMGAPSSGPRRRLPQKRARTVDAAVELWSTPTTLAIRARALVANNTDSDQLDCALGDLEQRCVTIADEAHRPRYFGDALSAELEEWRNEKDPLLASIGEDFHRMSSSDLIGALDPLIEVSGRWASRALGRSHAKARRGFIKWAKESWKSKAGVIYKRAREPQAQQTEVLLRDTAVADPCTIMRVKTDVWDKVWSDPEFDAAKILQ